MTYQDFAVNRSIFSFMYKVYGWMSAGLALSAVAAYGVYSTPALTSLILGNKLVFWLLIFAQLGLVIAISAFLPKMRYSSALTAFLVYALLSGATLSTIFAIYQIQSIAMVFGITVGMFGTMAIYGYLTRADLTSAGNILYLGLIGLIIASLVNIFLRSSTFDYVISFIGVLVFTGLTAYDVQKIKHLGMMYLGRGELEGKVALMGALTLYLDFVNLFLYLLNFLGNRKK